MQAWAGASFEVTIRVVENIQIVAHSRHELTKILRYDCVAVWGISRNMSIFSQMNASTPVLAADKPVTVLLSHPERALIYIILATFFVGVSAAIFRHQAIDWPDFWPVIMVCVEVILLAVILRKTGFLVRTATCMIAFGLILGFMTCCSILTFTILPFSNPMIDQQLLAADAALGFHWVEAVNSLADYPKFAGALRFIYNSLFPQIAFVMIYLSFLKRDVDLHKFLMVGFLSMIATDLVWWLFPSVGPAAYGMVSEDVQQKVQLIANAEYGEKMGRYATQGLSLITGSKMAGAVAFPSMHIVLTSMVLWFTRRTWMFIPLVVLNLLMPIATVLQGGHHIMDLFGGLAIFYCCVKLTNEIISQNGAVGAGLRQKDQVPH
jgi:membrane-associated phospholipid phosphatase